MEQGFGVAPLLILMILYKTLPLLVFERERYGAALKHVWLGEYGMVSSWRKCVVKSFHVGFVGKLMMMVIYFGSAHTLHLFNSVKILNLRSYTNGETLA